MEVVFLLDNCERIKATEIEDEKINGKNRKKIEQIIWDIMNKGRLWVKVRDLNGDYHHIFVNKICDIAVRYNNSDVTKKVFKKEGFKNEYGGS